MVSSTNAHINVYQYVIDMTTKSSFDTGGHVFNETADGEEQEKINCVNPLTQSTNVKWPLQRINVYNDIKIKL